LDPCVGTINISPLSLSPLAPGTKTRTASHPFLAPLLCLSRRPLPAPLPFHFSPLFLPLGLGFGDGILRACITDSWERRPFPPSALRAFWIESIWCKIFAVFFEFSFGSRRCLCLISFVSQSFAIPFETFCGLCSCNYFVQRNSCFMD